MQVKLLPCDHEVMGSSPGNSLLKKCRESMRTLLLYLCKRELHAPTGLPFFCLPPEKGFIFYLPKTIEKLSYMHITAR
jgi:hypothetical protein